MFLLKRFETAVKPQTKCVLITTTHFTLRL
jgi:hypothetical protein